MRKLAVVVAATGLLTACDRSAPEVGTPIANGATAHATLRTLGGAEVGRATATEVAGGLRVTVDAHDLAPGEHGAHVHTIGACDPPDFTTAGGHWNPAMTKHGSLNPAGPHEGDMPNLRTGPDGRGAVGAVLPGATMAGLLDADGAALVIHAGRDDLMTDPSGNSGGRIACGVFAAG